MLDPITPVPIQPIRVVPGLIAADALVVVPLKNSIRTERTTSKVHRCAQIDFGKYIGRWLSRHASQTAAEYDRSELQGIVGIKG